MRGWRSQEHRGSNPRFRTTFRISKFGGVRHLHLIISEVAALIGFHHFYSRKSLKIAAVIRNRGACVRLLIILPGLAGAACQGSPAAPTPVTHMATIGQAPTLAADAPSFPAPAAPAPTSVPSPHTDSADDACEIPAWQQDVLNKIVAEITQTALTETRRHPGLVVYFELHAPTSSGSAVSPTHVAGELRDPRQRSTGQDLLLSYWLLPGSLSFPDKYTFLRALEHAVTYRAEVRLVGGEITCCLDKRAIAVTGRFEGDF